LAFAIRSIVVTLIRDKRGLVEVLRSVERSEYVSLDTETTGTTIHSDLMVGVCIGTEDDDYYIPVRHQKSPYVLKRLKELAEKRGGQNALQIIFNNWPGNDYSGFVACLKKVNRWLHIAWNGKKKIEVAFDETNPPNMSIKATKHIINVILQKKCDVYMHNRKFDEGVLLNEGIDVYDAKCTIHDTAILSFLTNPVYSHQLKDLMRYHFDMEVQTYKQITKPYGYYADLTPIVELGGYGVGDVSKLRELYLIFYNRLKSFGDFAVKEYHELELPTTTLLMEMERKGIKVDVDLLVQYEKDMSAAIDNLFKKISDTLGNPGGIKLNSPKWLSKTLYDDLGLWVPQTNWQRGKAGYFSTDSNHLKTIASGVTRSTPEGVSVARNLIEMRKIDKLRSSFTLALAEKTDNQNRVHTTFKQIGTVTGRFSSSQPNLQQIPRSSNKVADIRKAFIAEKGHKLIVVDYSQIELRLLAHFSRDRRMLDIYMQNGDIHQMTADLIGCDRQSAKTVNFAIVYGAGPGKLSEMLSIPYHEAETLIANYFDSYYGVKTFIDNAKTLALKNGYVSTVVGRRRYLPGIKSKNFAQRGRAQRQAPNSIIQGSAADMIKIAARNNKRRMLEEGYYGESLHLLLQVHDELIFEAIEEIVEDCVPIIKHEMENVLKLRVPVIADPSSGYTWSEAKV
jgi:DNA polymerase-1